MCSEGWLCWLTPYESISQSVTIFGTSFVSFHCLWCVHPKVFFVFFLCAIMQFIEGYNCDKIGDTGCECECVLAPWWTGHPLRVFLCIQPEILEFAPASHTSGLENVWITNCNIIYTVDMFMWAISVIQVNEIILFFCIFQVFVGVKPVCVGRYVTVSFSFSRFFALFSLLHSHTGTYVLMALYFIWS